nr:unnamed protein product [Callosobruchus analis]
MLDSLIESRGALSTLGDLEFDGATQHYHRDVRAYLDQNLSGQWIGRRGPIEFPPRSPDLTPLDFFLWGTVKDEVYKHKTPRAVRKKNTREALRAHPYQAEVATPRTSLLQHSFFWRTSTLWNELPGNLFPDGYNLQRFKTNVHRHLSSSSAYEAP